MGKWFATFYDMWMGPLERKAFGRIRKKLLVKARGKVLEIGSGTGLNFPHYRHAVTVTAVEPDPTMVRLSEQRAKNTPVPIQIITAGAEDLPFPDDSFDTVVGTLVLCTIPDPDKALREIRRVCRPGGRILFFEHVRVTHPILGRIQDWLTPVWKRFCDGCHLNRHTLEQIERSGLHVIRVERYFQDIFLVIEAASQKKGPYNGRTSYEAKGSVE
ncbi:class I SAM-dependent methyltransferase [Desmospora profundinema]|uniref:Ubiquinone/menaquinone biosynthesis C-methylase UbiE n=1 Tax=Desmospora profundinema TaxID=1571184 RepID=A0ABU1IQ55_9BACL|nr:class I SAM-dependent methyltransferase [Desmospora profundinema]MDR6226851.1 ubiquinone/menaquinone biosynthesis C-methylase UbiE [Desmospora profundinema]